MSLSFRLRDFVFIRSVRVLVKRKVFKNRNVTSSVAYIINMPIIGFWYGLTRYCVTYDLFHGIGFVINDAWVRKKKKINRGCKTRDLPLLPDNKWMQILGTFVTFDVVMPSFLLFSGFLDQLWFLGTARK